MSIASRATRYSADDYTLTIAGVTIESGKGPDTFVEIAQQGDDFEYTAGIDGEGVFSHNENRYTLMSVHLLQTSSGNAVLSALHSASVRAKGLLYPIHGEDSRGTSKIVSEAAVIVKTPDETIARAAGETVWVIGIHNPIRTVGSH